MLRKEGEVRVRVGAKMHMGKKPPDSLTAQIWSMSSPFFSSIRHMCLDQLHSLLELCAPPLCTLPSGYCTRHVGALGEDPNAFPPV